MKKKIVYFHLNFDIGTDEDKYATYGYEYSDHWDKRIKEHIDKDRIRDLKMVKKHLNDIIKQFKDKIEER